MEIIGRYPLSAALALEPGQSGGARDFSTGSDTANCLYDVRAVADVKPCGSQHTRLLIWR